MLTLFRAALAPTGGHPALALHDSRVRHAFTFYHVLLASPVVRMWGMPIGEFFDLEALAKHCAETGRYTFFFSSWPLNVYVTLPYSRLDGRKRSYSLTLLA